MINEYTESFVNDIHNIGLENEIRWEDINSSLAGMTKVELEVFLTNLSVLKNIALGFKRKMK